MTSLPPHVPLRHRNNPHVVSAYNICLRLEKSLQEDVNEGKDIGRNMVYVRIMGYLIHHVPTDRGLKTVFDEIISSKTNSALLDLGMSYYNHYIRACTFAALRTHLMCPSDGVTQLEPIRVQFQHPPIMPLVLRLIQ
jgi:hypothetical protein